MDKISEKIKTYVSTKGLRWTDQRRIILETMAQSKQHLTTEELFHKVHKQNPAIGYATVARTLHLLVDAGLCEQIDISDGAMRYEVVAEDKHHDHLICIKCGKFIEVFSPELEKIQAKLVRQHGFIEESHKLQIFGTCESCDKQPTFS